MTLPGETDSETLRGEGLPDAHMEDCGRFDAKVLLGGSRMIVLVYEGTEYRLQLTSNNKLILTK
jgi:hemin uptake protein HemP